MKVSRDARIRTVARRGAGMSLVVLVLGFFLALDWAGTQPREVVGPEGGGQLWKNTNTATGESMTGRNTRGEAVAERGANANATTRRGATAEAVGAGVAPQPQAKPIDPLNSLVDGTGFIRFLGFTAISLGFALVVLVFFWSHRRDPSS